MISGRRGLSSGRDFGVAYNQAVAREISVGFVRRDALSRAELFVILAERCEAEDRELFEAFMEAAIVFGRTAIHRLQTAFKHHPEWKAWFASLSGNVSLKFFREQRDFILKEGSPKVGQIVSLNPIKWASELYYFENPETPAIQTVRRHLQALTALVREAKVKFSASSAELKQPRTS